MVEPKLFSPVPETDHGFPYNHAQQEENNNDNCDTNYKTQRKQDRERLIAEGEKLEKTLKNRDVSEDYTDVSISGEDVVTIAPDQDFIDTVLVVDVNSSNNSQHNNSSKSQVKGHRFNPWWLSKIRHKLQQHSNFVNLIVLGIAFCTFFTAFNTLQGFLTDLKKEYGFYALAILYLSFTVSVPLVPAAIELFGARALLFVSSLTFSAFVLLAIFEPMWPLMIASVFNGVGGAVLWTAHGTFLVQISGDRLGSFTGIFFAIFTANMLIGNLLAGSLLSAGASIFTTFFTLFIISVIGNLMLLLLTPPKEQSKTTDDVATTEQVMTGDDAATESPSSASDNEEPPSVSVKKSKSLRQVMSSVVQGVRNTGRVMIDKRMLLFVGVAIHNGFTISLFFGVIPSTIGEKGQSLIGYCMAVFGCSEILGSVLFGKLIDSFGKRRVMSFTMLMQVVATVLIWSMSHAAPYLFFVTTFVCGLADSGYNTSIFSIIGAPSYFKDRASDAIAAFKLLQSAAITAGFFLSRFASRTTIKIILSVLLLCAMVMWFVLEFLVVSADKKVVEDGCGAVVPVELIADTDQQQPEVMVVEE